MPLQSAFGKRPSMDQNATRSRIKLAGDIALLALFLLFSAAISDYVLAQIIKVSTSTILDDTLIALCVSTVIVLGGSIALVARHLLKYRNPSAMSEAASGTRSDRIEG